MKTIITMLIFLLGISEAFAIDGRKYRPEYLQGQYMSAKNLLNYLDSYGIDSGIVIDQLRDKTTRYSRAFAVSKYGYRPIYNSDRSTNGWVDLEIKEAWTQGYEGEGVDVYIKDSFYKWDPRDISHGEKTKAILGGTSRLNGYDYVGIAPEANITTSQDMNISASTAAASGHYDIVNLSLGDHGQPYTFDIHNKYNSGNVSRWIPEIHENTLVVKSAGNRGDNCLIGGTCSIDSIDLVTSPDSDNVLIVGAVDRNGNMYHYSNKAGNTKDNYVVDHSEYTSQNQAFGGTSASAPTVSGKAAIIKSKFPSLTGSQLANVIKTTADDLGAPGVDIIYGHGRVNLTRALSPVGTLR